MASAADGSHIQIATEVDDAQWAELCAADARADVFHESWLLRAFAETLQRSRACWLLLRDDAGRLLGGIPFVERQRGPWRAWISSPGGAYGGPVCLRDPEQPELAEQIERQMLSAFSRLQAGRVLRRELVFGHRQPVLRTHMHCIDSALLVTEGGYEEFLRERFPKNRRNECNRSERRGLAVSRTRDPALLQAFYPIYAQRNREWGSEALPLALMLRLLERSERFHFFAAVLDGQVVGGHLCAQAQDELFAWVGTTQRLDGTFPSSLLIREEARFAAEHGLARLNLGSSLGLSGVHNYKRLLGAQSRPLWVLRREFAPLRLWRRRRGRG